MANVFAKLYGTVANVFRIGLNGPQLKSNAGVMETRDANDAAYAVHRAASPVGNDDVVTKLYGDTNYIPDLSEETLETNDANWNTIGVLAVAADTAVGLSVYIVGKEQSGGPGRCNFHGEALYYRVGTGALTQEGQTNTLTYRRNPPSLNAQFLISGNNVLVQVKGIAATGYNWKLKYRIVEVDGVDPTP